MIPHNNYIQRSNNVFSPTSNIQYVQGEAGAKAYPVTNNYMMLLMDSEDTKFYIKQTDQFGIPKMRKFKFEEIVEEDQPKTEYVTKADFEELKNQVIAMQQPKEIAQPKAGDVDV